MAVGSRRVLAGALALVLTAPAVGFAQDGPPVAEQQASVAYAPQRLDQILAPVALYPDPLLADILTASTYPLEVIAAERWVSDPQNAAFEGDQLQAALQTQDWDPSVKSLVPFPQILKMMSAQLDWMQQLGTVFLAQQADVMNSVQRLRQQAAAAGHLASTPQQTVVQEAGAIEIAPATPQTIYVPVYNPQVVYAPWPYPNYPPDYIVPPGYYYEPGLAAGIFYGAPVVLVGAVWFWGDFDWRRHRIHVDRDRFDTFGFRHAGGEGDFWQHDPWHRRGVDHRGFSAQQRDVGRFNPPGRAMNFSGSSMPQERRTFRGGERSNAASPPPPSFTGRPAPMPQIVRPPLSPRPQAPIARGAAPGSSLRVDARHQQMAPRPVAPAPPRNRSGAEPIRGNDGGHRQ